MLQHKHIYIKKLKLYLYLYTISISRSVHKMFTKISYNALHGIILFRFIFADSSDLEKIATSAEK